MDEGPEAAQWRELVALYRAPTMNGSHILYFVGGPLDLSKRVEPGDHPRNDRYVHRTWTPCYSSDPPPAHQPASMVANDIEYRLMPLPVRGDRGGRRVFLALAEELY